MDLLYKIARHEDIDLLTETRIMVLRDVHMLENNADMSKLYEQSYKYYYDNLASQQHVAYLVYDGNKVVGTGGISFYKVMPTYENPSGEKAYLMNVYTDPDYRRQGIATNILKILIRVSLEKKVDFITLEATDSGRNLYEKNGFKYMGSEMRLEDYSKIIFREHG